MLGLKLRGDTLSAAMYVNECVCVCVNYLCILMFACVCICVPCVQCTWSPEEGTRSPRNGVTDGLFAVVWILGAKSQSYGRAASAPNS